MDFILAAVSGLALVLAFPRVTAFPLAWVALVPLLIALRGAGGLKSFLLGLTTGVVFFGGLLYWISLFGYLPLVLLTLVQGLSVAVFALIVGQTAVVIDRCDGLSPSPPAGEDRGEGDVVAGLRAGHQHRRCWANLVIIPAVWTSIEWLKSLGTYGFTWGGLAYSQAGWPAIIQIASVTGPWGVTFVIVLVNAAIARFIIERSSRSRTQLAAVLALVAVVWVGGAWAMRPTPVSSDKKRVALVQGGIEMTWRDTETLSEIYRTYWPMTERLPGGFDFVVWPESALPDDLLSSSFMQLEMARLARMTGAYIVAGGPHVVPDEKTEAGYREYNGAYLISPDGKIVGEYFKVHLVPFGEFVPGRKWLPSLDNYRVREVDYSSGTGWKPLQSDHGDIGVLICFESIFPQIGRKLASDGAEYLFVITNDSWFGRTAAAAQHHAFSVLRAVENRRYVVRNATTGISRIISPTGEVRATAGLGKKAVVSGAIQAENDRTFYTKYGDWFAVLSAIVSVLGTITVLRSKP